MKYALAVLAILVSVGCDAAMRAEMRRQGEWDRQFWAGEVQQIAQAPDGTRLYRVHRDGKTIYFSSRGSEWDTTRLSGRTQVVERNIVPNAQ